MSVATEIARIQSARNSIREKFVALGLSSSTDDIDDLATAAATIVDNGAVNVEIKEGESYTIAKGFHNGAGVVKGVAGGGNYQLQEKSVTPTKQSQSITSDEGYYGLSGVIVAPIPNAYQDVSGVTAIATDVLTNKIFVDSEGTQVAGTMPNNGDLALTINGMETDSVAIPAGYTNGGTASLTASIETALAAI